MAEQDNKNQQPAGAKPATAAQQQARPCPKDCTKCGFQQHAYCAARMSFQMFEVMNSVIQRLDILSQRIADLEQRIIAIQSSGAELISPSPMDGDLFAGTE